MSYIRQLKNLDLLGEGASCGCQKMSKEVGKNLLVVIASQQRTDVPTLRTGLQLRLRRISSRICFEVLICWHPVIPPEAGVLIFRYMLLGGPNTFSGGVWVWLWNENPGQPTHLKSIFLSVQTTQNGRKSGPLRFRIEMFLPALGHVLEKWAGVKGDRETTTACILGKLRCGEHDIKMHGTTRWFFKSFWELGQTRLGIQAVGGPPNEWWWNEFESLLVRCVVTNLSQQNTVIQSKCITFHQALGL